MWAISTFWQGICYRNFLMQPFFVGGGVIKSEKGFSAFEGSLRTVTWYIANSAVAVVWWGRSSQLDGTCTLYRYF